MSLDRIYGDAPSQVLFSTLVFVFVDLLLFATVEVDIATEVDLLVERIEVLMELCISLIP